MKRILILTAGIDPSGDAAARQLADEITRVAPREARVDVVDPSMHGMTWGERLRRPFHAGAIALRGALLDLLRGIRPDAVVVLHPAHAALLGELHRGRARDYALVALVTAPGETGWDRAPVDTFIVPGEAIAATLPNLGPRRVRSLGFPVLGPAAGSRPDLSREVRVLWMADGAGRKGPKLLDRLLARPDWQLTIVTDDAELGTLARENSLGRKLDIVGDFKRVPSLLARHHVVIARPETALWQEAIVAGCPLIAFHGSGAGEEANAALLERVNAGGVARKPREVTEWIDRATRDEGRVLELWRRNAESLGRPHGGEAIARFLLDQAAVPLVPRLLVKSEESSPALRASADGDIGGHPLSAEAPRAISKRRGEKKLLLCDLHTHTTWSDGKLTVSELVDFYGQRGFDCLCVTDHLCDPKRLLGKLVNLTGLVIPPDDVARYFAAIEREKKRAWSQYKLLLMAGIEFNKDGYTPKTSAHLLGVDLKKPIDPSLDLPSAHREFWSAQRQADQGTYISRSYLGSQTGRINFGISRRRTTRDGKFDGIVHVAVAVSYFYEFWKEAVAQKPDASIGLIRSDGEMLARFPDNGRPMQGLNPASSHFMAQLRNGQADGVYRAISSVDQIQRIYAYAKVGTYPLFVRYGIAVPTVLVAWRQHVFVTAATGILVVGALVLAVLSSIRNLRRLMEEQTARSAIEDAAQEGQRLELLGQLAAGVAHDFANIVQAVATGAYLLDRAATDPVRVRSHAKALAEAAKRGASLTQRMLDLARRGDDDDDDFSTAMTNPAEAISGARELLSRILGDAYRLRYEIGTDALPLLVRGDRTELEAALMNLAVNARDAMPLGGDVVIHAATEHVEAVVGRNENDSLSPRLAPGTYVRISVSDSGVGMTPEVLARAGEIFFTTKPRGRGTGLGLAGARGFAERSGGGLLIESEAAVGTTVTLWLPAVPVIRDRSWRLLDTADNDIIQVGPA